MQLKRAGGDIAYDFVDANDGQPPVLFLHGALGVRAQFDALRAHFADRSQLALDFPSHGASPVTHGEVDAKRLARDVLELLDALQIAQVDIIGHSMGGYVGLVMAHLAPARVGSVVTLGTKFYWRQDVIDSALQGLNGEAMRSGSQRFYDALAGLHAGCGIEQTLAATRSLIAGFGSWQLSEEMVRAANVPLLICAGDRDNLVPPAEAVQLFGALDPKIASLAVIPGTPHPLQHLPLACFEQLVRRLWEPARSKAAAG